MAAEGTSVKRAILIIVLMLALPVGVAAQSAPNLQVLFTRVSDSSPVAGGRFTLRVRVINWGDWPAAATTLRYYRTRDFEYACRDGQGTLGSQDPVGVDRRDGAVDGRHVLLRGLCGRGGG